MEEAPIVRRRKQGRFKGMLLRSTNLLDHQDGPMTSSLFDSMDYGNPLKPLGPNMIV